MNNTEIIHAAAGSESVQGCGSVNTFCKVCGKVISEGIREKDIISGSFTNYSECRNRDSKYICAACAWCLKSEELRKNSFIADKNRIYYLKKNDIEEYLFNLEKYVEGEFVIGITTSFKKHNSFRCRVNSDTESFYIRQEDREYSFDAMALESVYGMLNEAYLTFNKEELGTGRYAMYGIEQFGLDKFREYEKVFARHRGSAQFELMIYMLNSERRAAYIESLKEERKLAKRS